MKLSTTQPHWKEREQDDILLLEEEDSEKKIVLYNDDVNTFDFVIESLITLCGHTPHQAENCTMIIHFKGKCAVKFGSLEDLLPIHQALLKRGLTSQIE